MARIPTDSILSGAALLRIGDGNPLCADPGVRDAAKKGVCAAADIAGDPSQDFSNDDAGTPRPCNALSAAAAFTAEPALLGDPYDPPPQIDGGCPANWTTCP